MNPAERTKTTTQIFEFSGLLFDGRILGISWINPALRIFHALDVDV